MPQPLSSVIRGADFGNVTFAPGTGIHLRPHLAPLIMETVTNWAYIDLEMSRLMAKFLTSDFEIVTEMLLALNSAEAQRAAIRAAATAKLSADDIKLFDATMKAVKPSKERRNEFVHCIWGTTDRLPNDLLLIEPKYLARKNAVSEREWRVVAKEAENELAAGLQQNLSAREIMVYTERDIDADLRASMIAHILVLKLRVALADQLSSDEARRWLLEQPQIQQFLQPRTNGSGPKAQQ